MSRRRTHITRTNNRNLMSSSHSYALPIKILVLKEKAILSHGD
jgi:hypothetical protein